MCVYLYMELAIHTLSSAVSQRERDSFEFNSMIVLNKSGVQLFEQLYVSLVSTDDKHWYFDWNDEPTEVDGNILCSIALRLITLIVFYSLEYSIPLDRLEGKRLLDIFGKYDK